MRAGTVVGFLAAAVVGFALFAAHLVMRQFGSKGFSAASSLSTERTGCSAYFDSLPQLGITVLRKEAPFEMRRLSPKASAVFVLSPGLLPPERLDALFAFARRGGRVVLSGPFHGISALPLARFIPAPKPPRPAKAAPLPDPLQWRWRSVGIRVSSIKKSTAASGVGEAASLRGRGSIPFNAAMAFKPLNSRWENVVSGPGGPLVTERRLGAGRLILLASSDPLTNRVLRRAIAGRAGVRGAVPLARWLLGRRRVVMVDETVHAVEADPGILWLLRRYRLLPALAGCLFLFLLYAWGQMVNLMTPMGNGASGSTPVAASDPIGAQARILQRVLPPARRRGNRRPPRRRRRPNWWHDLTR